MDSIAEASSDIVADVTGWITDIGKQYSDTTEQIKEKLKDPAHIICKVISKGTGFTYATQQGYADGFLESVDGEQYCVWMWKGDYLNLGAGAETGIYKGGEPFWDVAVDDAMPMTLTTYDKDGNTIMCYMPDDPQWWITGFDSMTQDIDPDDLTVIGSIDMSSNSELFLKFIDKYGKGDYSEFCFDKDNKTVYYRW